MGVHRAIIRPLGVVDPADQSPNPPLAIEGNQRRLFDALTLVAQGRVLGGGIGGLFGAGIEGGLNHDVARDRTRQAPDLRIDPIQEILRARIRGDLGDFQRRLQRLVAHGRADGARFDHGVQNEPRSLGRTFRLLDGVVVGRRLHQGGERGGFAHR